MPEPVVPATPPAEPPATPPAAPEPKPAEKKLLDDLKKWQTKAKTLEEELAVTKPVYEKFKGHEDAKALEATREAEARAKQESQSRATKDLEAQRERAILKALLGVVPSGDDDLAEFAVWKLTSDPTITYDPETNTFAGLAEARAKLAASPRFAAVRRAAPGLPDVKGQGAGDPALPEKFKHITTLPQLQAMPMEDQMEFAKAYPARHEALRAALRSSLATPRLPVPPPMGQSYQAPAQPQAPRR